MNRIIRQVFGTTRPRDIWNDMLTFDRLVTKPVVHIVYWAGLGLFVIFACGWVGIMVGTGMKDGTVWGWALSFGLAVAGLLAILIGVLAWRSICEFYLAVMSIADDLRHLRQYQEKLEMPAPAPVQPPAPVTQPVAQPTPAAASFAEPTVFDPPAAVETPVQAGDGNILDDPFFRPRFETRE